MKDYLHFEDGGPIGIRPNDPQLAKHMAMQREFALPLLKERIVGLMAFGINHCIQGIREP